MLGDSLHISADVHPMSILNVLLSSWERTEARNIFQSEVNQALSCLIGSMDHAVAEQRAKDIHAKLEKLERKFCLYVN